MPNPSDLIDFILYTRTDAVCNVVGLNRMQLFFLLFLYKNSPAKSSVAGEAYMGATGRWGQIKEIEDGLTKLVEAGFAEVVSGYRPPEMGNRNDKWFSYTITERGINKVQEVFTGFLYKKRAGRD